VPVTSEFVAKSGLWVIDVESAAEGTNYQNELTLTVGQIATTGGGTAQLWIHDVSDDADALAQSLGAAAYRDLWQVRCPLPAARSTLETRAFTAADTDLLVAVNNRAFSWHPEQSGVTRESLETTMAEPWFNPDGFRLFERDGELLGFCWTKVHPTMEPVHGEIYVIAVDPSVHGQGLGTPMTLAGLDWISDQGIEHALLYVESDNDPANATYLKIGFTHFRTDRAYNLTIAAAE
jgi:mycothiol synthase